MFLGAFTYGIVYTVWLKRRSTWNIVIGGLAGSFAVLAGAAAVDPSPQVVPVVLAVVLFLWTPPHFWSLAAAKGEDYAKAGIPMLPVVVPAYAWTLAILTHTVALVAISLVPLWFGEGLLYGLGAGIGGGYFLWKSIALYRDPDQAECDGELLRLACCSLALLIAGALLDSAVRHLVMTRWHVCGMRGGSCLLAVLCASACRSAASHAARSRARRSPRSEAGDRTQPIGNYTLVDIDRRAAGAARLSRQAAGHQPGLLVLQLGLPADHPASDRRRQRGAAHVRRGPLRRC